MSGSKTFNKEFIKELADLLAQSDLTEIELQEGSSKLRVAREVKTVTYASPQPYFSSPAPQALAASAAPSSPQTLDLKNAIKSPMVGTVYIAAEPGSPPFIQIGDTVKEGQTILIVEAMKVMNNIPAPRSGKITQILVSDKDPVEYDQPLAVIE